MLSKLSQADYKLLDRLAFTPSTVVGHAQALPELRALIDEPVAQQFDDLVERIRVVGLSERLVQAERLLADAHEKGRLLNFVVGCLGRLSGHVELGQPELPSVDASPAYWKRSQSFAIASTMLVLGAALCVVGASGIGGGSGVEECDVTSCTVKLVAATA